MNNIIIPKYSRHEKKWNCPHINKNDVLIYEKGRNLVEVYEYNTDWPQPEDDYEYVFLVDIFPNARLRSYEKCDCKPV